MKVKNPNKVRVRLQGGLGNNLFQYAAGKYVSLRCNANLVVDLTILDYGLSKYGYHLRYLFQDFQEINYYNKNGLLKEIYILIVRSISKCAREFSICRIILKNLFNQYHSNEIGYDDNISKLTSPIALQGYYQTWKHIEELKKSGNLVINFKNKSDWLISMESIAVEIEPIMLHVRRGDYKMMKDDFGLLSYKYYFNSLEKLPANLSKKQIWIFSDDIEEAREMFKNEKNREFKFIAMPVTSNAAEVMYLISLGSGHIIANSTFSYWGAYLSQKSQIIIAPSKWFKSWEDPKDLINPEWIRVQSEWE